MTQFEESLKAKAPATRRTADMEVVAQQARKERAKHTAWIAQLDSNCRELKSKFDFFYRHNNIAGSMYFLLDDECDLLWC